MISSGCFGRLRDFRGQRSYHQIVSISSVSEAEAGQVLGGGAAGFFMVHIGVDVPGIVPEPGGMGGQFFRRTVRIADLYRFTRLHTGYTPGCGTYKGMAGCLEQALHKTPHMALSNGHGALL